MDKNFLRFLLLIAVTISINSCSKDDYVTCHCSSLSGEVNQPIIRMILEGSEMHIENAIYHYCGSLGPTSYFSSKCDKDIEKSSIRFKPSTGEWNNGNNLLICKSL